MLTGEPEGLELDVAVPAIEHGAQLEQAGSGFVEILERARRARQHFVGRACGRKP